MLFTLGGSDYICSGSVVKEVPRTATQSMVLTAGHCASENDGSTKATNWMFIPSFDTAPTYTCGADTYGCWVADAVYGVPRSSTPAGSTTRPSSTTGRSRSSSTGGKTATSTLSSTRPSASRFPIASASSTGNS